MEGQGDEAAGDGPPLPAAIRLSRRARNNIKINIALSLAVVAVLTVAALAGCLRTMFRS